MSANLEPLIEALLDACVELRQEIDSVPPDERPTIETVGFEVLETIRRSSPAPALVRRDLVERAAREQGFDFAAWLDQNLTP